MRFTTGRHILATMLVGAMYHGLQAEVSDSQVRSAAQAFVDQVPASVRPPGWEGARVDQIETISAPSAKWHVCRIAKDQAQAGYALVLEQDGSIIPKMYGGTDLPRSVVSELRSPASPSAGPVPQVPPANFQGLENLPMIASFQAKQPPVQIDGFAGCFASVFSYWVSENNLPLFKHPEHYVYGKHGDPFKSFQPPAASMPAEAAEREKAQRTLAERLMQRIGARSQEKKRLATSAGLYEEVRGQSPATMPQGATATRIVGKQDRLFEVMLPLLKQDLFDPITPQERWRAMGHEQVYAEFAAGPERSDGMVRAYLICRAYLNPATPMEKGVESFLLSRGFRAACSWKAVSSLTPEDVPCVLCNPARNVAVTLVSIVGQGGSRWALVYSPDSVRPIRQSRVEWISAHADLRRKQLIASGMIPPAAATLPSAPQNGKSVSELEAFLTQKEREHHEWRKTSVVVSDPMAIVPASLDEGGHIANLDSCFVGWQALVLTSPVPADNWGSEELISRR